MLWKGPTWTVPEFPVRSVRIMIRKWLGCSPFCRRPYFFVKLKLKVWIVEGKLSIRYFSKRNSLILTINTWPDVPKSSIRFPEWNIFLCSEPSRQNNGKKHLHPSPSADDLVVSLSQLSQMLIPIFYLLLENRTKKSQKFALQMYN